MIRCSHKLRLRLDGHFNKSCVEGGHKDVKTRSINGAQECNWNLTNWVFFLNTFCNQSNVLKTEYEKFIKQSAQRKCFAYYYFDLWETIV